MLAITLIPSCTAFVLRMLAVLIIVAAVAAARADDESSARLHGYSVSGEFMYPGGFDHFRSASPEAPRSCELRLAMDRSFDSLNPWIIRGRAPLAIYEYLYDSLLEESGD